MESITLEDAEKINLELQKIRQYLNINNAMNDINANYAILANSLKGIRACDDSFDKMNNIKNKMYDVGRDTSDVLTEISRIISNNIGN